MSADNNGTFGLQRASGLRSAARCTGFRRVPLNEDSALEGPIFRERQLLDKKGTRLSTRVTKALTNVGRSSRYAKKRSSAPILFGGAMVALEGAAAGDCHLVYIGPRVGCGTQAGVDLAFFRTGIRPVRHDGGLISYRIGKGLEQTTRRL